MLKRVCLLPFLLGAVAIAQPPDSNWYWRNGDYLANQKGIYAYTMAWPYLPMPGARTRSAAWKDLDGNFWLFGGDGYDGIGHRGNLNDLWKLRPFYNDWTWMKGSNLIEAASVYVTKGVAGINNTPGGRYGSATWTDNDGNLWLFGGERSTGMNEPFNDLWKYNIASNQWTLMKGDTIPQLGGSLGTQGVPDDTNQPVCRRTTMTWKDKEGNLWMFGGIGGAGGEGISNDLWKYTIGTNQWTWMKGASMGFSAGVYGTQGVPAADNTPGARYGSATWTDASGNFWLWGGNGVSETPGGLLNDLWKYDVVTNMWTWMKGAKTHDQLAVYGTKGTGDNFNTPGGREGTYYWTGMSGDLWLFGGIGPARLSTWGSYGDLWKYNISNNQWTWIKGDTMVNRYGRYNVGMVPDYIQYPGTRWGGASWTTPNGGLWMFGGDGYASTAGLVNDLWAINVSNLIQPVNLPVKLVSFSALLSNQTVKLSWQTTGEVNFRDFTVQRGNDGSNYQNIAIVPSNTQSSSNQYGYTDMDVANTRNGKLFYRLKMADEDESFTYSKVIVINLAGKEAFTIYPNPVADRLSILLEMAIDEQVLIRFISQEGRIVKEFEKKLNAGKNVFDTDVKTLPSGIYILAIQSQSGNKTIPFMKE
jgi:hypothetical protein